MWIRTQDRKSLCEVKNKIAIIHDDEDTDTPTGIFIWDSSLTMLGEFKTKERALEVLEDIQNKIKEYECCLSKHILDYNDIVYEMPLE